MKIHQLFSSPRWCGFKPRWRQFFFFNFSSHLLPPTYVNFYPSFLQIQRLLLVPNLEQSGGTLSKSWNYEILWSERMLKVTNFTIPSLKVQNSFCSEHLYIIKYQKRNQKFARIYFVFSYRIWHLCNKKYTQAYLELQRW